MTQAQFDLILEYWDDMDGLLARLEFTGQQLAVLLFALTNDVKVTPATPERAQQLLDIRDQLRQELLGFALDGIKQVQAHYADAHPEEALRHAKHLYRSGEGKK